MTVADAVVWREKLRESGKSLVFTNGCFDIMHRGHAEYLCRAAEFGDALLVALNSDSSVKLLKGPDRPIIDEFNRAYMLASLRAVDTVVVFNEMRCSAIIEKIKPDIYVKGGDYREDTLDPEEYRVLTGNRTKIQFIPFVDGFSTTQLLARIANHA